MLLVTLPLINNIDFSFAGKPACTGVPPSPLPKGVYPNNHEPRWANSGAVIGSVAAMRAIYDDIVAAYETPEWRDAESDQGDIPS